MSTAAATRPATSAFDGPPAPEALRPRFPRLMGYLDALPAGIHSYPECRARSGIQQTFLQAMPATAGEMDSFVVALLRPSARAYIPEVVLNASILAMADATRMTDAKFLEWNRATNREMFGSVLYRALMAIFSPAQLIERAPARWESFHPGTTLTVKSTSSHEGRCELTFPERLFTPLLLEMLGGAMAAALEHARARDVTLEVGTATTTAAEFVARWR
jgi:hypothetical protein